MMLLIIDSGDHGGDADDDLRLVALNLNKTIGDEGITVDFWIIKVHTSN